MDQSNEEQARVMWVERRRRLAIKKLGGVKEEEYFGGFGVENNTYGGGYSDAYMGRGEHKPRQPSSDPAFAYL